MISVLFFFFLCDLSTFRRSSYGKNRHTVDSVIDGLDRWVDRRMDRWMDGQIDRQTDKEMIHMIYLYDIDID